MGYLTQEDVTLYRGWFKEMAHLRGIPVKYQYIMYADTTIHAEVIPQLSDPIDIDIIFEENPKTATLRKIGWVSEFPDDKPYIAYLPDDTLNLTVEARITISPISSLNQTGRTFRITTINRLLEYPDAYICTLAPVLKSDAPKTDYRESNFNYVASNDAGMRGETLKDKNFSYIEI